MSTKKSNKTLLACSLIFIGVMIGTLVLSTIITPKDHTYQTSVALTREQAEAMRDYCQVRVDKNEENKKKYGDIHFKKSGYEEPLTILNEALESKWQSKIFTHDTIVILYLTGKFY